MAEITPAELLKKLKSGEFCNVYYIYGKDTAAVENAAKAVMKKRLGKDWSNNVTRLTGSELDLSVLSDMLEACPMFAEVNAILINDLNADDFGTDEIKFLTNQIDTLPEYTLLLISITGFDVKKGKKVMTAKNKKLADCIAKNGIVCECNLKTTAVLAKLIIDKVQKQGCSIQKKTAEMLAEACVNDSLRIENELEKLCAYRQNEEIRPVDIDELVAVGLESDAFKLSRAIISYNPSVAMEIMNKFIQKKEEPVPIISAVSMAFIDLYRARTAMTADKRASDVIEDFQYGNRKFAVDNAFRDSRRISLEGLRNCIFILRKADKSLKQTGAIPTLILEKTVTELLMSVRRK